MHRRRSEGAHPAASSKSGGAARTWAAAAQRRVARTPRGGTTYAPGEDAATALPLRRRRLSGARSVLRADADRRSSVAGRDAAARAADQLGRFDGFRPAPRSPARSRSGWSKIRPVASATSRRTGSRGISLCARLALVLRVRVDGVRAAGGMARLFYRSRVCASRAGGASGPAAGFLPIALASRSCNCVRCTGFRSVAGAGRFGSTEPSSPAKGRRTTTGQACASTPGASASPRSRHASSQLSRSTSRASNGSSRAFPPRSSETARSTVSASSARAPNASSCATMARRGGGGLEHQHATSRAPGPACCDGSLPARCTRTRASARPRLVAADRDRSPVAKPVAAS